MKYEPIPESADLTLSDKALPTLRARSLKRGENVEE